MNILALDTACSACSAAVWTDGAVVASHLTPMSRGHAEALLPMVLDVVRAASISFSALDLVAVTLGPGSFTGLRTGVATAKGIALARDLPVVGVTSLEAVALAARSAAPQATRHMPLAVVLETKRGSVYQQSFAPDLAPLNDPCSVTVEEVANTLPDGGTVLAGDAASRIVLAMGEGAKTRGVILVEAVKGPDATYVAEIAAGRWADGTVDQTARALTPLYIQAPEAKRPVAGGRLRS